MYIYIRQGTKVVKPKNIKQTTGAFNISGTIFNSATFIFPFSMQKALIQKI